MMAWVASVVWVMWQTTCGVVDLVGEEGERARRVIAMLDLEAVPADGAAVEAGRGAGLEPAHAEPEPVEPGRQTEGRRLVHAAGRDLGLADMDQPVQEGAGGQHHGAGGEAAAVGGDDAGDAAVVDDQVLDRGLDHFEARGGLDRRLHGLAVELAVGLGARALHGGALAAVEHPELDAGLVGDAAHQPVKGIDLAHQMALAQAADGRIAGHLADGGEAVGDEGRLGAQARRRGRGLAAGMAAADDDDIEALALVWSWPVPNLFARFRQSGRQLFHVNQVGPRPYLPMQNSAKMAPSTSSTSIRPVSRPRWRAARRSSSALSSGLSEGSPNRSSAACAASSSTRWRARVRSGAPAPDSAASAAFSASVSTRLPMPSPVLAETLDGLPARACARRQIDLVQYGE